jgi:hypothetical protein
VDEVDQKGKYQRTDSLAVDAELEGKFELFILMRKKADNTTPQMI